MTRRFALLYSDGSLTVFKSSCTAKEANQQCVLENAGLTHSPDRALACEVDLAAIRILRGRHKSRGALPVLNHLAAGQVPER